MQTSLKSLFLACLLLAGCVGSQIYQRQLITLNKGMSPAEATANLQQQPLSTHHTKVGNTAYSFQRYNLNNGRGSDLYLLCYENKNAAQTGTPTLKYWGYIEEFRRYPDHNINQALENVLPEIRAGN